MTALASALESTFGADNVIGPGDERLEDYGHDESPLPGHPPEFAVTCQNHEQIVALLRLASERGFPVTPRGAGSGKTGGAIPHQGGVVLSVEAMNRIIDIDDQNLTARVEPGVITGQLQEQVLEHNLFYPPDPASLAYCSIGGNAACNAGGPRAFRYGVTRHYVLGAQVVLAGGESLKVGCQTAKGVTGYDLVGTFVGSEGTLGIIDELTLRLIPAPDAAQTLLATFSDVHKASQAVTGLLKRKFWPRALELADRQCVEHIRDKSRAPLPKNAGAFVLTEIDGHADGLEGQALALGQALEELGAQDIWLAQTEQDRRDLWDMRRGISRALSNAHQLRVSEDVCVPRAAMATMLQHIDAIAADCNLIPATFGHAGDGNLHASFLVDDDPHAPDTIARVEQAIRRLFEQTIALGGTLSGEHGIGLAKRDYMPIEQSPALLQWQRRIKQLWDPDNLLNPGKVLPRQQSCHE